MSSCIRAVDTVVMRITVIVAVVLRQNRRGKGEVHRRRADAKQIYGAILVGSAPILRLSPCKRKGLDPPRDHKAAPAPAGARAIVTNVSP